MIWVPQVRAAQGDPAEVLAALQRAQQEVQGAADLAGLQQQLEEGALSHREQIDARPQDPRRLCPLGPW